MYRAVFIVSFALGFSAAQAQEIHKPTRVAGDWCEYDVEAIQSGKQRREVVDVAPDGGYTMKFTDEKGEELRVSNADNKLIQRGDRVYTRISGTSVYPIRPGGRNGGSVYTRPHATRSGVTVDVTTEVKAIEPERVAVPAGTFDTLRVDWVAHYRQSSGYANQWIESVWFSLDPSIKFPVKLLFQDYGSRNSRTIRSLIRCGSATASK